MSDEEIQSVSDLTESIKFMLNTEYARVLVNGEISGINFPRSGHVYFNLKDETAQLSAVLWRSTAERSRIELNDGMQVVCRGYVDVYPLRGAYQLIVQSVAPVGDGSLQQQFRRLHERLSREGVFDDEHKKKIPKILQRLVIVTSPTGAAIRDFLKVLNRRWPFMKVLIYPVAVQGKGAAQQICKAIKRCNSKSKFKFRPDAILVTRGGGSIEDLWAFNEEEVIRAIFKSKIPIMSAIGHEIDVTLTDLVADARAQTPTEAAELLAPDQEQIIGELRFNATQLSSSVLAKLAHAREKIQSISSRPALKRPMEILYNRTMMLDSIDVNLRLLTRGKMDIARAQIARLTAIMSLSSKKMIPTVRFKLEQIAKNQLRNRPALILIHGREQVGDLKAKLVAAINKILLEQRHSLEIFNEKLIAINPKQVLSRGYTLTLDSEGNPVVDCENISTGDNITTLMHNGSVKSQITTVEQSSVPQFNGEKENS